MYSKTKRLELKPISEDSLDALVELLTDETVGRTYMVPEFPDRAVAEKLARRLMDMSRNAERLIVGICLDGRFIGLLNETGVEGDSIELGYALLPAFQNRGYATEALGCAIGYCFRKGFRRVTAGAFRDNPASLRVMEKCGMKPIARTERIDYRGSSHECVFCAIEAEARNE